MSKIIEIYVKLIQEGRRTLQSVPATIRSEVEAALAAEDTNSHSQSQSQSQSQSTPA